MANFRAFYQKHRERLFAYLMRSTGDYYLSGDILQESFTRYLEKYGGDGQNTALLYTIARNAVVDGHRKQGRDAPLFDELEHSQHNPEADMLVDIDMCGSQYDTRVWVWDETLDWPIACNDDYYSDYTSKIENLAVAAGSQGVADSLECLGCGVS